MKNLNEINITRAIACIFVVLTHSMTSFIGNVDVDLVGEDKYIVWLRFVVICATPIFILLSETLISKNYPNKLPKGFFIKRIKYILVPYILVGLLLSYRDAERTVPAFLELAYDKLVYGNWYGFFVLVIIQFYILHWLVGKYLSKINPIIPLVITFVISYAHMHSFVNVRAYYDFIITYYPLSDRIHLFNWLFYFVVAYYIGRYYEEIMSFLYNKVWLLSLAVAGSYFYMMYNVFVNGYGRVASERYDLMFYTVSLFFLLLVVIRKYAIHSELLIKISSFSYFIYLTHLFVMSFYVELTLSLADTFFGYVGIMTFLTIATSIGWAFLFYSTRTTQLFTGKIKYLESNERESISVKRPL